MTAITPSAGTSTAVGVAMAHGRAWPGQSGLPLPADPFFVERPDTVPDLIRRLAPGEVVALVPAHPRGGGSASWRDACGKTALAAHAAASLRRSGVVGLTAWVDASSQTAALGSYLAIAEDLGLDCTGDVEATAASVCRSLQAATTRWVLVLDDLRDPADLDGIWPVGPAGTVLITTGDPATAEAFANVQVLPVPFLSQRESMDLLSRRLSTDPDHRSGQIDLALVLDGEPAALAQASAVIATSELTCREYLAIFGKRRSQLEVTADRRACAASVTWTMSAEQAEILEPGAGTWLLLVLAALLSPHGVPADVLSSASVSRYLAEQTGALVTEPGHAAAVIAALRAAGLLAIGQSGGLAVARMTSSLQAAVLAAASPALLHSASAAAADALTAAWPTGAPQSALAALLRSCAASLRSVAGDALWEGGRYHRVLVAAGQSMDAAGLHLPAASWWRQLADDSARHLGTGHDETVAAASLAASALLAAGQSADAVTWAEWVMTSRAAALGTGHPGTVKAATLLGRALAAAGRPVAAITLLDDAATRSAHATGNDNAATLAAWDEHAVACLAAGKPTAAISSLSKSLATRRQALGTGHPATMRAATQLARAYLADGQHDKAISMYEQALSWLKAARGPDHADTLPIRVLLAGAHSAAGHVSDALRHYQKAHGLHERALGPSHRQTLACAAALARAYADAGQITAAMSVIDDAIGSAEQNLPPGDPLTQQLRQARASLTSQVATG
jgi:tetratricopeptide (TPR) repeat protein